MRSGSSFRTTPEIVSWHPGDTGREDLWKLAEDALLLALHTRVMENDEIPKPSAVEGTYFRVPIRSLVVMKLALNEGLRQQGSSRRDLARKLGKSNTIAGRLLAGCST